MSHTNGRWVRTPVISERWVTGPKRVYTYLPYKHGVEELFFFYGLTISTPKYSGSGRTTLIPLPPEWHPSWNGFKSTSRVRYGRPEVGPRTGNEIHLRSDDSTSVTFPCRLGRDYRSSESTLGGGMGPSTLTHWTRDEWRDWSRGRWDEKRSEEIQGGCRVRVRVESRKRMWQGRGTSWEVRPSTPIEETK